MSSISHAIYDHFMAVSFTYWFNEPLSNLQEDFITATQYFARVRCQLQWQRYESSYSIALNMEAWLSLQLPLFNSLDIKTWFAQLHTIFSARRVTSQKTKFAYIVEKISTEVARKILDLLNAVPEVNQYDTLGPTILHRTGDSEEKKLSNRF